MVSGERLVSYKKWTGLNTEDEPMLIKDSELQIAQNLVIGQAGNLLKRAGFTKLGVFQFPSTPMRILGQFLTSSFNSVIAASPTDVYKSDDNGLTWTLIGTVNNAISGVQYLDTFYMVTLADGIQKWDGAAFAPVGSSPSGIQMSVFKERLWVVGTSTESTRLFYSDPGVGRETWGASSFLDIVRGDGDKLVAVVPYGGRFVCFKSRSVHNLYLSGDPASWQVLPASLVYGCTSPVGVIEVEGLLYFISNQGVYRTDGNLFREISGPIRSSFRNRQLVPTFTDDDSISYFDRKVYITYNSPAGFRTHIFHIDNNGWTELVLASGAGTTLGKIVPVVANDGARKLLASARAGSSGFVFELSQSNIYKDNGFVYDTVFRSKRIDFDEYPRMKRGKLAIIEMGGGSQTKPLIGYYIDGGDLRVVVAPSDLVVDSPAAYRVRGPEYFREVEIYMKDITDQAFNLMTISLYIYVKSVVGDEKT